MLSVLIPTYNYDVKKLVKAIHKQGTELNVPFEIIVFEDGSSTNINSTFNLSNIQHIVSKKNIGRVEARKKLAQAANYDYLLFLDADVLPKKDTLLKDYLKSITNTTESIFGGFAYHKEKPQTDSLLRWFYGKNKEEIPAITRNKKPYKVIISANFLIKKDVFMEVFSNFNYKKGYGFDSYFSTALRQKKHTVLHINNEVYHLGLEKSEAFLIKVKQSTETLLELYKTTPNYNTQNDLLNTFVKLKKTGLSSIFSLLYRLFKKPIKTNLLSKKPSLLLLQLYKISYMCFISKK